MELTGLEGGLLALNAALLVGALVPTLRGGKYMTRKDCDRRHKDCEKECDQRHDGIGRTLSSVERKVNALILWSDRPGEDKEKVLNDRGIDHD
ncbi:hypothetical protein [Pseudodesulfovibrio karagichevae]|jgi:hypothetical protein|uniref:Uncharacterized protein n=1 Tax=Pseudodesulfovibrio karagichevae TaxID=3239305 RepID=A0ABV4K234_9BACT